jgi:NADH:ubiquinone oxidoreductase subunit K
MDYIILSVTLLAVGIYGLLTKRHLVKVLISIEIIASASRRILNRKVFCRE